MCWAVAAAGLRRLAVTCASMLATSSATALAALPGGEALVGG